MGKWRQTKNCINKLLFICLFWGACALWKTSGRPVSLAGEKKKIKRFHVNSWITESLAGPELESLWLSAWPSYKQLIQQNLTSFKDQKSKGIQLKDTTTIQESKRKKKERKTKDRWKILIRKSSAVKWMKIMTKHFSMNFKPLWKYLFLTAQNSDIRGQGRDSVTTWANAT